MRTVGSGQTSLRDRGEVLIDGIGGPLTPETRVRNPYGA
jgi:hypothetical protein